MYINEYFHTPIWSEQKSEFVTSLNKASNKYINEARKKIKIILSSSVTLEQRIIQHL